MSKRVRWVAFLAILLLMGCAGTNLKGDPLVKIDVSVLRGDVEEFEIMDARGRVEYRIRGLATEVYYYPQRDGTIRIVRIEKQPRRETIAVPAAGAAVETVLTDGMAGAGGRTARMASRLGPGGEFSRDRRAMIERFISECGAIPSSLGVRHIVRNDHLFLEDRDPDWKWSGDNERIPASLALEERIEAAEVDGVVKDSLAYSTDTRLKWLFVETRNTPLASLVLTELKEPEGAAKYRKLLALAGKSRQELGKERAEALEGRYRASLEAALYQDIVDGNKRGLLKEYAHLFAKDRKLSRLEEIQTKLGRKARGGEDLARIVEKARVERCPELLEEFARASSSLKLAKQARAEKDRLRQELEAERQTAGKAAPSGTEERPGEAGQPTTAIQAGPSVSAGQGEPADTVRAESAVAGEDSGGADQQRVETRNPSGASDVAVFSRPTTFSDVVTIVRSGERYPLKSVAKEYYLIEYEPNRFGYVHRRFVK